MRMPRAVELLAFPLGQFVGVREEDKVVRPLADELCVLDRAGAGAEHPERLVADFEAVAVGAVEEVSPPALPSPGIGGSSSVAPVAIRSRLASSVSPSARQR